MRRYTGSCHCSGFVISLDSQRAPTDFVPRSCGCAFCVRHGSIAVSDPEGLLSLEVRLPEVQPYRFGLGITDFYVCPRCGTFVAAAWRDGDALYGVVNVRVLDAFDQFHLPAGLVSFDGETISQRENRRRLNWTPTELFQT